MAMGRPRMGMSRCEVTCLVEFLQEEKMGCGLLPSPDTKLRGLLSTTLEEKTNMSFIFRFLQNLTLFSKIKTGSKSIDFHLEK